MKKLIFIALLFVCGCSGHEPLRQEQPGPGPQPQPLRMSFSRTSVPFEIAGGESTVEVDSSQPWSAHLVEPTGSSWLTFSPSSAESGKTTIRIAVAPNNTGANRTATIGFGANNRAQTITITQAAARPEGHYTDGQVVKLQSATTATGRGIELIIMGDGFTAADMANGGRYETVMRQTMEHYFAVYPYSVHRGRFNVWMIIAISNQAGISVQSNPAITVDNKFRSVWEGGESTGIECDETVVRNYVSRVATQTGKYLNEMTVVMPINANINAGTTTMHYDGFSYALCTMGSMYPNIVVHESGGHGFAKLGDEYAYNESAPPANRRYEIQSLKTQYGWYENLDFSANIAQTSWRGFAGNPKYPMVATFEGGSSYTRGIWRPEANSVMIGGVLYFNAPSRWAAMRRMNELEGTPYTFAQFLVDDAVPTVPPETIPPGATRSAGWFGSPPIVVMPEGRIGF